MLRASTSPHPRRRRQAQIRPGPWLLLFVAGLAVRAAFAFLGSGLPATPAPAEAAAIETIAAHLARGDGYAIDGHPTALLPPFVPWLASLMGRGLANARLWVVLGQCAMGALVPLLVATLGAILFGSGIGRLAGWLAVGAPLLVGLSSRIGLETASTFLLLTALLLSAAWVRTPRSGRALGVGLAWGAAALAQEGVLLLVLLVGAWAWVPLGLTVPPRERARQLLLVGIGLLVLVGPWTLRNALVLHAFVPVSTGTGAVLLGANNDRVWSDARLRGGAVEARTLEGWDAIANLPEAQRDQRMRERAIGFVDERAARWPAVAGARLARLWSLRDSGDPADPVRAPGPLLPRVGPIELLLLWGALVFPFAAWGIARTVVSARRWYQSLALLPILWVSLCAILTYGAQRQRAPAEPMLALFAAAAFVDLRRRLRTRRHGLQLVRHDEQR